MRCYVVFWCRWTDRRRLRPKNLSSADIQRWPTGPRIITGSLLKWTSVRCGYWIILVEWKKWRRRNITTPHNAVSHNIKRLYTQTHTYLTYVSVFFYPQPSRLSAHVLYIYLVKILVILAYHYAFVKCVITQTPKSELIFRTLWSFLSLYKRLLTGTTA